MLPAGRAPACSSAASGSQEIDLLGHLSFGVADLARTTAFYDAVLGALGYARVFTASYAVGYGLAGTGDDRLLLILQAEPVIPPGPGFHLAFSAASRPAVDRFHAAALQFGGIDRGAPGLRPDYGADYYAAFVLDPDGYKLEAKHPPPANG
jgi:catechol 2,3-dioxygenase-like lactoylglutathione lyase family enzyme